MKQYKKTKNTERIIVDTEVIEIIEQQQCANGRLKNVFKCKSKAIPEGRMCISWGASSIVVGSKIRLEGYLKNSGGKEIFLAKSTIVDKYGNKCF